MRNSTWRTAALAPLFAVAAFSDAFGDWANPDLVAKVASDEVKEARASWWGFDEKDSTKFLQAAINSGAERLVVDRMPSPWVSRPLKAASNQHLVLEKGVVLLAKRGEFTGRTERLLAVDGVENVRITGYGATLRMWREDYAGGRDGRGRDYERGEWRHAMTINGSRGVVVEGLTLEESGGDGIYIAAPTPERTSRDIVIRDCVCDRNHRQGISVISAENLLVENCVFRNTQGVAPEDGVDFEPNKPSDHFVNCVFRNCVSENNVGNGFEIALSQSRNVTVPCSIRFENCRTAGDTLGIKIRTRCRASEGDYPTGTIDFVGCTVSRSRYEAVEIMQNPKGALQVALTNCTFESIGTESPDAPAVALFSPFLDDPKPAMPSIKGLKWPDRGGRSPYRYDTLNFAALGEESLGLAPPDTAGVEAVDLSPGEVVRVSPLRFRRRARLVAYADRARRVTVRGEHFRAGPPSNLPAGKPVAVSDASGAAVAEIPLSDFGPADLSFDAPAEGFYFMDILLGSHSFAVTETDSPLAADVSPAKNARGLLPQGMLGSEGSLFLCVAAGERAEVRVAGARPSEAVAFAVSDMSGNVAFEDRSVRAGVHFLTPASAADRTWRVSFAPPAAGTFDDFCVAVAGVRPFLFFSPEKYWRTRHAFAVVETPAGPRLAIDGVAQNAVAALPDPFVAPGGYAESGCVKGMRQMADAGVRLFSNVWSVRNRPNDWWLGEGKYDWDAFDAMAQCLLDACPDGWVMPRVKIEPPEWWIAAHPEELSSSGAEVRATSRPWRELYRTMLRDVLAHAAAAPYASRVVGWHIGGFHCGEWQDWKRPRDEFPAVDGRYAADPLAPPEATAKRRAYQRTRAREVADVLLDAAGLVKELTHGEKIVCAFFGYGWPDHEDMMRVVRSGLVDVFSSPAYYGGAVRGPGAPGALQACYTASYALHGRLFMEEADPRTHLAKSATEAAAAAALKAGKASDLSESVGVVRRIVGRNLAQGTGLWWFLIAGNETFDAPEIMESVRVGVDEMQRTLGERASRPFRPDVAVFTRADEYATSLVCHSLSLYEYRYRLHTSLLPRSGVAYDSYELSDIVDPRVGDYSVYVLPNAFYLSDEERAAVARLEAAGRRIVRIPEPIDADSLRARLASAGAHVYLDTGDVVFAGRGYLAVHASKGGLKRIRLPGKCDVTEIFGAEPAREGVCGFNVEMKFGETRVYSLSDAISGCF